MTPGQQQSLVAAAQALNSGDARRAAEICEQLLAAVPGQLDCQHLLGVALISDGKIAAGEQLLGQVETARPNDPEVPYNHASALLQQGHAQRALALFDRVLTIKPDHAPALNNRASALLAMDQVDRARQAYSRLLKIAPGHASGWFNLGNLEVQTHRQSAALAAYQQAVTLNPNYCQATLALGQLLLDMGQLDQARAQLSHTLKLDPESAQAHQLLAQALAGLNRFDEAVDHARAATVLTPESALAWNCLGAQLTSTGELTDSEHALRRALALDSELVVAWSNLAALLELANRPTDCETVLHDALGRWPDDPSLLLTQARIRRSAGDTQGALAALDQFDLNLDPHQADAPVEAQAQHQREGLFLRGQLLDRSGEFDEAFAHYQRANELSAATWTRGNPAPDTLFAAMADLADAYTPQAIAHWATDHQSGGKTGPSPAFVVGFQRSGTTLLDTMLGARGDVLVMEELPVLNAVIRAIGDYPRALFEAGPDELARWRQVYWDECTRLLGDPFQAGFRVVDKSPLHTVHLGLIHRLFPAAPVVLALRHPLDVVLSCFMQDFTLSAFMLRYTTLDGVSVVYQRVMDLLRRYRKLLPLKLAELRYEQLVVEPEPVLRELTAFLDLDWDPAVLDHTGHAKNRGLINTPSYHQVTQPLYTRSSYRWRNYRAQLAPVIDDLAPYCEQLGYENPLDVPRPLDTDR